MSLYSWMIIIAIAIASTFSSMFVAETRQSQAEYESVFFEKEIFQYYSNYTRQAVQKKRGDAELNNLPLYVNVLNVYQNSSGSPIEPDSDISLGMLTTNSISRLALGNILTKHNNKTRLFIWANPKDGRIRSRIQKAFTQDGFSIYYIKDDNVLIYSNRPGETVPIEPEASAAIPNGSIVVILYPLD